MAADDAFSGDIPEQYDQGMGPVLFEPYSIEMAKRVHHARLLLETAAGTGRLTNHLIPRLASGGSITATDPNPDMIAVGRSKIADARVRWQTANALDLPFESGTFDTMVCQFGLMFFPDKARGHQEAHRVLQSGGTYLVSVWGPPKDNRWVEILGETMVRLFPINPPSSLGVPFGYNDVEEILGDIRAAGFSAAHAEDVEIEVLAPSAYDFARGVVAGSPLSTSIRKRGIDDLDPVVDALAASLSSELGDHPMRCATRAIVFQAIAART